LNDEFVMR